MKAKHDTKLQDAQKSPKNTCPICEGLGFPPPCNGHGGGKSDENTESSEPFNRPKKALEKITGPAHIPAIGYAYVDANNSANNTSITFGQKNAQSTDHKNNEADAETCFPASSLSKIVFTYLVLRLVQEGYISLDEKLYKELPYDRVMVDGKYPDEATREKAEELTVRHVLSHTSGLPNVGSSPSSTLKFHSKPGEKYEYSGEAILYLQKFIEKKMGEDLQTLAQRYIFDPKPKGIDMNHSTFLPPSEEDTNNVLVHSELGKSMTINESLAPFKDDTSPLASAAGSLLTTANDFSKFMAVWLEMIDDETFKQAFEPPKGKEIPTFDDNDSPVCGLGWHLYKDDDGKLIAYQYGENTNTRSFVAINVTDRKGAVFFTNCEHGMSIANQIFSSVNVAPIGKTTKLFKSMPRHAQSDEPGWKETLAGKLAEDQGNIENARYYFTKACFASNQQESKLLRLKWFKEAHPSTHKQKAFEKPLETFQGVYTNPWGDRCEMSVKDGSLVYEQPGRQTKLLRISETDFLPEKDQSFKISIEGKQMTRTTVEGDVYKLSDESLTQSQKQISSDSEVKGLQDAAEHSPMEQMEDSSATALESFAPKW
ncbi:serine hydrolase domain-containing protein [Legionella spiritensis]|uniref:Putative secreted esterase n=1 Tax=Legionella spiritensis TaxID=452 RepID=A0A0W0YZC5_LEGSP|nr:serine hydrolase domain-containing protein [Legionella spiritensis]KTD61862.1 putative secreted esterase [Legionella spiritensis]SNV31398.1 putative secreted esterase [Legionella spiritensis]